MFRDTYLSAVDSRLYSRRDERFKVNLKGQVEIIMPRLSGIAKKHCRIADISVEGAALVFEETLGLPLHFYLTIDGYFEKVGCAEVNRVGTRVGVRFLRSLDERWLKLKLGDIARQK
ncbi:MAG: hypothetical protein RIR97_231 [Pseudomonadota bacterium]|jgi:hypothetical protein